MRGLAKVLPSPRTTPFTFWYLVVLLGTTLTLRLLDSDTDQDVLEWASTNVQQLSHAPLRTLVVSALWLPGMVWLPYALSFTLVLAPVERRIGWRWTLAVFASGHVLATLATEAPIAWLVDNGTLPHSWTTILDVGVSYGFYTVYAVLVGMFRGWPRWALLAAAEVFLLASFIADPGLDGIGHPLAFHLGVALWWRWLHVHGLFGSIEPPSVRAGVVRLTERTRQAYAHAVSSARRAAPASATPPAPSGSASG